MKHLSDYTRALCLAGIATAATAGTGTGALQFIAPTTYVDGSALPLSDIAQYDVDCGFKAKGATTYTACVNVSPTFLSATGTTGAVTFTLPPSGGDACFKLRTVTIGGAVSAWTDAKCKTFAAVAPNAPSGLTVTVTVSVAP
jgi:hypothetical protein